jgi:hypothetical protein
MRCNGCGQHVFAYTISDGQCDKCRWKFKTDPASTKFHAANNLREVIKTTGIVLSEDEMKEVIEKAFLELRTEEVVEG